MRLAGALALAASIALQMAPTPAAADEPTAVLEGTVVGVTDGDTLTLLVDERPFRVRLAQIDAPERGQPYGQRAKAELSRLAFGKRARAEVVEIDGYGRSVAEVFVDGIHLNADLVRSGHAWAYTRYARSAAIIDLENEARAAGRGLWQLPEAERDAPWEWRRRKRRGSRPPSDDSPDRAGSQDPRCGTKRTCSQMESCSEARFYLTQCGLAGLDGDGDGVPCESRCSPR